MIAGASLPGAGEDRVVGLGPATLFGTCPSLQMHVGATLAPESVDHQAAVSLLRFGEHTGSRPRTGSLIDSVKKTHRVVIVHKAPKTGGFGADVGAILAEDAFNSLDAAVVCVAAPDIPIRFSPPMEGFSIPSEDRSVEAVKERE